MKLYLHIYFCSSVTSLFKKKKLSDTTLYVSTHFNKSTSLLFYIKRELEMTIQKIISVVQHTSLNIDTRLLSLISQTKLCILDALLWNGISKLAFSIYFVQMSFCEFQNTLHVWEVLWFHRCCCKMLPSLSYEH